MLPVSGKFCKVKITGGLGNQLFKFANGLRVSTHFGSELILETSFYDFVSKNQNFATPRDFALDYFPALASVRKDDAKNPTFDRIASKFWRELPINLHKNFGFYGEEDNLNGFKYVRRIEGSFEDLKFLPEFDVLLAYLRFPQGGTEWLLQNIRQIEQQKPLSLHVRRTDFLKMPELYGVVDRNYYVESISRFKINYPNNPIWLFSDDIQSAIDFLGPDIQIDRFMGPEVDIGPAEVMNLLSRSLGVCAANSTFSWWAGFFGTLNKTTEYVSIPSSFNTLHSDNPSTKLSMPSWTVI